MKLEATLRAGKVEKVINKDAKLKYFTGIIDDYVEEKGFKIEGNGESYYLTIKGKNVKLFLDTYSLYYCDNNLDNIIDLSFESFKEILFILIEEAKEKMKELKEEEKIILEIK